MNDSHNHAGADDSRAGLIPRALKHLFAKISEVTSDEDRQHCRIIMSYVEIYNERLHDLLQPYKPNARLDPQVRFRVANLSSQLQARSQCVPVR